MCLSLKRIWKEHTRGRYSPPSIQIHLQWFQHKLFLIQWAHPSYWWLNHFIIIKRKWKLCQLTHHTCCHVSCFQTSGESTDHGLCIQYLEENRRLVIIIRNVRRRVTSFACSTFQCVSDSRPLSTWFPLEREAANHVRPPAYFNHRAPLGILAKNTLTTTTTSTTTDTMCFVHTLKDNGIQCSANFDRHFLFCLKRFSKISQIHSVINLYIVYGSWVDYIRKEWTKWVNGFGRWRRLYTAREKNKKTPWSHMHFYIS